MEGEIIEWSIPERKTEGMQDERRQNKLKAGELKRETESLICAVQEQAIRTNTIKNGIDQQVVSLLCREKVESVTNIVSLSSVLAGNQYQRRHDKHGKKSALAPVQKI